MRICSNFRILSPKMITQQFLLSLIVRAMPLQNDSCAQADPAAVQLLNFITETTFMRITSNIADYAGLKLNNNYGIFQQLKFEHLLQSYMDKVFLTVFGPPYSRPHLIQRAMANHLSVVSLWNDISHLDDDD